MRNWKSLCGQKSHTAVLHKYVLTDRRRSVISTKSASALRPVLSSILLGFTWRIVQYSLWWICLWIRIYRGADLGLGSTWDSLRGGVPVERHKHRQRLFVWWRCHCPVDRALLSWLADLFFLVHGNFLCLCLSVSVSVSLFLSLSLSLSVCLPVFCVSVFFFFFFFFSFFFPPLIHSFILFILACFVLILLTYLLICLFISLVA